MELRNRLWYLNKDKSKKESELSILKARIIRDKHELSQVIKTKSPFVCEYYKYENLHGIEVTLIKVCDRRLGYIDGHDTFFYSGIKLFLDYELNMCRIENFSNYTLPFIEVGYIEGTSEEFYERYDYAIRKIEGLNKQ